MWRSMNVKTSFPGKKGSYVEAHNSESIKEPRVELQGGYPGGTQGFWDTTHDPPPHSLSSNFLIATFLKNKTNKQIQTSLKKSGYHHHKTNTLNLLCFRGVRNNFTAYLKQFI